MHYFRTVTDLETGEAHKISLGEHVTFTEAAAKLGVTRANLIKVLKAMRLVREEFDKVADRFRNRLHPDAVKKGLGFRIYGERGPFDVLSPLGFSFVKEELPGFFQAATACPDTMKALEAMEKADALRLPGNKLDTEGKALWLLHHHPRLEVRAIAKGLGVSERLVHRYKRKRADQLQRAQERKAMPLEKREWPPVSGYVDPAEDASSHLQQG